MAATDRTTNGASSEVKGPRMLMALSDLMTRMGISQRLGKQFSGNRDLYTTLGYKSILKFEDYLAHYERSDIAAKIVDLPAKTTWRNAPVFEVEGDTEGDFQTAVSLLDERFRLFHYLSRVDRLSGIGHYGCILLGIKDGKRLEEPIDMAGQEGRRRGQRAATGDLNKLLYLSVFSEGTAEVLSYIEDEQDPRFGKPEFYELTLLDTSAIKKQSTKQTIKRKVHWSRVIHVMEDPLEDDVFGTPRIQRIFNRLDDLQKLVGGSAEMFWQNVAGVWHADLDPEVQASPTEQEAFEEQFHEAMHGLRRILQTRGVDLQTVGGGSPDPKSTYEVIIALIAATAEIPLRILMGNEQGELASSQDQREWHSRIGSRQEQHAEPTILRPTIDMLIRLGILPDPGEDGYSVTWNPLDKPTGQEKAAEAKAWAEAAKAAAPAGAVDLIVPPWEFRERFMDLPADMPDPPAGFEEREDVEEGGTPPPPPNDEEEEDE